MKKFFVLCFSFFLAFPAAAQVGWKISLAGDVMLGTNYPGNQLPANNGAGLLDATHNSFQWADIALANLEGALATGGQTGKVGCSKCYAFRTPPSFAQNFARAGIDGFSQANNHALDFGANGLMEGARALRSAGIQSTGWQGSAPAVFERNGQRACMLAFAPNKGMNDLRNISGAQALVRQAKKSCHLVIVSFHGGAEGSDKHITPQGAETYLGENRGNVRAFSRGMIDAGAGLVFGHGPHIPRGMEVYNGHLIAYSLGNFMTYGGMSVTGALGLAPLLMVQLDNTGRLQSGRIVSFRQRVKSPIMRDSANTAARFMINATQRDFKNAGGLRFTEDGGFYPQ